MQREKGSVLYSFFQTLLFQTCIQARKGQTYQMSDFVMEWTKKYLKENYFLKLTFRKNLLAGKTFFARYSRKWFLLKSNTTHGTPPQGVCIVRGSQGIRLYPWKSRENLYQEISMKSYYSQRKLRVPNLEKLTQTRFR